MKMLQQEILNKIIIDRDLCNGCEACIEICPRDCLTIDIDKKAIVNSSLCHDCGHCISICPKKAIKHRYLPNEDYGLIEDKIDLAEVTGEKMYYFLKALRSTRKYKQKEVKKEILERLVDLVRYAPTGHHSQNVVITIITNPGEIQKIKDVFSKVCYDFIKKADNPIITLIMKLIGKGGKVRKMKEASPRFIRMINGFKEGIDYLFHGAPVIVIFHANKKSIVPADNCTIASDYMRIAAQAENLGSCYIGYLTQFARNSKQIRKVIHLPQNHQVYQTIILGHPKHQFKTFVSRKSSKVQWF
ncbi:MAG: 4Fe-4S dicluster domain-containing protein [Asgard group archaeon]|nr:4Fe-4S dicluster domain-containing protein [Asgard group archaeon]